MFNIGWINTGGFFHILPNFVRCTQILSTDSVFLYTVSNHNLQFFRNVWFIHGRLHSSVCWKNKQTIYGALWHCICYLAMIYIVG